MASHPVSSPIEGRLSHPCFGPKSLPDSVSNSSFQLRNFCSYQQDDWVDWTGLPILRKLRVSSFLHPIPPPKIQRPCRFRPHSSSIYYPIRTRSCSYFYPWRSSDAFTSKYQNYSSFRQVRRLELPPALSRLHAVFNVNLLEPYFPPSVVPDRLQPSAAIPEIVLEEGIDLNVKGILDVRKIGRRFDYLLDFLDKPISERLWIPLSDIPSSYDEIIEQFHRRHPKLPKPSTHCFKNKNRTSLPVPPSPIPPIKPSPVPTSFHDPLALPPRPISPQPDPDRFSYRPPSVTTTRSKRKSRPRNLDVITDLVTSNRRQESSAP